jgi:hypothetical protein
MDQVVEGFPSMHNTLSSIPSSAKKKKKSEQVPVAHAYNPSYSGSKDQEDRGSKPARGK